jgi:hypothetical protein
MNSLVLVSNSSLSLAFELVAPFSEGWLVDSASDPATELRGLEADGFPLSLSSAELAQLHSEVLLSVGSPDSGQLVLRRVLPVSLSTRAVRACLENNAEIGCVFSADLQLSAIRSLAARLETRHGFVTAGLLVEAAAAEIAGICTTSIWSRCPDSDFDHNTLLLLRDQQAIERVEAACLSGGIVRSGTSEAAIASWRQQPRRSTYYVGTPEFS